MKTDNVSERDKMIATLHHKMIATLSQGTERLGLSVRPAQCLSSRGIRTIAQLVVRREARLLSIRNFGKTSLREVVNALEKLGLRLGMELGEYGFDSMGNPPVPLSEGYCEWMGTFGSAQREPRYDDQENDFRRRRKDRLDELALKWEEEVLSLGSPDTRSLSEKASALEKLGLSLGIDVTKKGIGIREEEGTTRGLK